MLRVQCVHAAHSVLSRYVHCEWSHISIKMDNLFSKTYMSYPIRNPVVPISSLVERCKYCYSYAPPDNTVGVIGLIINDLKHSIN